MGYSPAGDTPAGPAVWTGADSVSLIRLRRFKGAGSLMLELLLQWMRGRWTRNTNSTHTCVSVCMNQSAHEEKEAAERMKGVVQRAGGGKVSEEGA